MTILQQICDPQATTAISRALQGSVLADEIARLAYEWEQVYAGTPESARLPWASLSPDEQSARKTDAETFLICRVGHLSAAISQLTQIDIRSTFDLRNETREIANLVHQAVSHAFTRFAENAASVWRREQRRLGGGR